MPKNKNLYAVILAGGSGTRFWPMSKESKPKQYLNIIGKDTLFQKTLKRISARVDINNIFIVTSIAHKNILKQQMSQIKVPKSNILYEPAVRNTAPAILWASAKINKINPNATIAIFPSDHLITEQKKFFSVLDKAVELASDDYLVTFGIVPTRPETGFGYLKTKKVKLGKKNILKVEKFTEKPSVQKAKRFVRNSKYFWNSGMFVWKSSVILKAFNIYMPGLYRKMVKNTNQSQINKIYKSLTSVSIDYGILEKSDNVAAIKARNIGWSDLGSWESLMEVLSRNKDGNYLKGNIIPLKCRNTLVIGDKKLIAAVGLENIVIVDTPEALLICQKHMSQQVRDIVSRI
jgi:mannose-1-phosphate guanylyltransferase